MYCTYSSIQVDQQVSKPAVLIVDAVSSSKIVAVSVLGDETATISDPSVMFTVSATAKYMNTWTNVVRNTITILATHDVRRQA